MEDIFIKTSYGNLLYKLLHTSVKYHSNNGLTILYTLGVELEQILGLPIKIMVPETHIYGDTHGTTSKKNLVPGMGSLFLELLASDFL